MCGISLALAALGNLLNHPLSPFRQESSALHLGDTTAIIRYICGGLSALVLLIFALKLFVDAPHAREELKTPVPLSVLPTATMALMLLSTYLIPHLPTAAVSIWYLSVVVHIGLMVFFMRRFVLPAKLGAVFPSWFIVSVGIVTASVTAPAFVPLGVPIFLGQMAFYIGFILYFITLPFVIVRLKKVRIFPEAAKSTIAIFAAPMGLLIVGYYSSFVLPQGPLGAWQPTAQETRLVFFMLGIAALSYVFALIMMAVKLLWIRFYPSYSAFTFPLVISALAFRMTTPIMRQNGMDWFATIADVTMWIAVAIVIYVMLHYIKYFCYWLTFTRKDTKASKALNA